MKMSFESRIESSHLPSCGVKSYVRHKQSDCLSLFSQVVKFQ